MEHVFDRVSFRAPFWADFSCGASQLRVTIGFTAFDRLFSGKKDEGEASSSGFSCFMVDLPIDYPVCSTLGVILDIHSPVGWLHFFINDLPWNNNLLGSRDWFSRRLSQTRAGS